MATPPNSTAAAARPPTGRKHAASTPTTATWTATVLSASCCPAVVVFRTFQTPGAGCGQKRPEAAVLYQQKAVFAIENCVIFRRLRDWAQ
ncbi:hypothetical protein GCM10010960_20190 [Arenimonas maotaiensis]|uniref:Uncharacterized protein n=1 Tax=Arenimonas maotaiensis TaxID=1446479 RepID=A0A917CSY0_9GAMM|nr:hypothetical protein GCM10010960_20190 [Arenimonas maotaiensis]